MITQIVKITQYNDLTHFDRKFIHNFLHLMSFNDTNRVDIGITRKRINMILYRLEEPEMLVELGLHELQGGDAVLLVEWGERFAFELGNQGLWVYLLFDSQGDRLARLVSHGPSGERLLRQVAQPSP